MYRIVRANRLMRSSRITILVGFGLVLAATLALSIGLIRSRDADTWVVHTLEVQQTAQTFLISTRDAESSVRSFDLSGDNKDLETFEPALAKAMQELDALKALTSDNSIQQDRVQKLRGLVQSKGEQLSKCVAPAKKEGQRDAALAIINSPGDRGMLADIRTEIELVLSTERNFLATARLALPNCAMCLRP